MRESSSKTTTVDFEFEVPLDRGKRRSPGNLLNATALMANNAHEPPTLCPFSALNFAQVPTTLEEETLKAMRDATLLRWHPDKAAHGASREMRAQMTRKTQEANEAYEILHARITDPNDPLNGVKQLPRSYHDPTVVGGQRGHGNDRRSGEYRLRCARFAATISGLREGELTLEKVELQLTSIVQGLTRHGKAQCGLLAIAKTQWPILNDIISILNRESN